MATNVTVLGASGEIAIPYDGATNAARAQALANQISAAITGGTLYAAPYNASGVTALPSVPGGTGPQAGEYVIGGGTPTTEPGTYFTPAGYPAIVNNANNPVTITAGASNAPYSVLAGNSGTTFYTGSGNTGGAIFFGGGNNTLAGGSDLSGINGNWSIGSGGATGTDEVYLGTGNDTLQLGANDTIHAGSANIVGLLEQPSAQDPVIFLGSGASTIFGFGSGNVQILGQGASGGGVYVAGSGGNSTIVAGGGSSTLVGSAGGDVLFASSAPGAQAILFAGAGNETLQAGAEGGSSTLYGGSGGDILSGGAGNDVIEAGSGPDSIWTGLGSDTVWFVSTVTSGAGATDIIEDFDPTQDVLALKSYAGASVTSGAGQTLQLTLSDNTKITFQGLTTEQYSSLNIKNIS